MGATENKAAVVAAYQAFGAGDVAAVIASNAPDAVWVNHSSAASALNGEFKGHDDIGNFFGLIGQHIEFSKFDMAPIAAEGDVVVAMGEQAYTVKSTGKTVAGPLIHIFTFGADGLVHRFEEFEANAHEAWS